MKMQIKISTLKAIIQQAEQNKKIDSSLSDTILFEMVQECDTHNGEDYVHITQKSGYSECNGRGILL